jgi:hypothetical protein
MCATFGPTPSNVGALVTLIGQVSAVVTPAQDVASPVFTSPGFFLQGFAGSGGQSMYAGIFVQLLPQQTGSLLLGQGYLPDMTGLLLAVTGYVAPFVNQLTLTNVSQILVNMGLPSAPMNASALLAGVAALAFDHAGNSHRPRAPCVVADLSTERGKALVEAAFGEVDLLLTASSMEPACRIDDTVEVERTYPRQARTPFNVTGHPAISVMCGVQASTGLPIGLQLVAPGFAEARLFAAAAGYERAAPWGELTPGL